MNHRSFVKPVVSLIRGILLALIFSQGITAQTTQTFTSSNSFNAAAGVTSLSVECWGGGGGGGNAAHTGTGVSWAGGGAGGAYAKKVISSPSGAYTVTVGTGGTGGNAGGDSWFGCTCTVIAKGGVAGGNANKSFGSGGTGTAAGSNGDAGSVFGGGSGAAASVLGCGAGGSGAGSTGTGNNATVTINNGAAKANNGGAGGAGFLLSLGVANGNNASDYGGGGGGASCATIITGSSATGGKGGEGLVTVTYTCPTYNLTNTANTSTCAGNTATVTLTSAAANLPTGTYTVTYNLSSPNAATGNTATMTVSTAGTGTFTTSTLSNSGSTTITITNLKSGSGAGCTNNTSSNNTATITVDTAPSITTQPATPSTTCSGSGTQTISVIATGSGLLYSWRKNGNAVSNGGVYSGQGTSTLTLTNPTTADAGTYDVIVSGTCTPFVTSNSVTVTVNAATSISSDVSPINQLKLLNVTASDIAISATGTSISYQWYSNSVNSNSGGTSVDVSNGGQTNTYSPSTSVESTLYYYCVVSGTCGTATSSVSEVVSTNTDTWLGLSSADWSNSSNWNTGTSPSGNNNVVIPTGNIPYPMLSASSAASNIDLQANTTLTIGAYTFTVNGLVSGTGNFIGAFTSGLTINGNAGTIYFDNNSTNNYLKNFTISNGASVTLGNELNITACDAHVEGVLTVSGTGILTTGGFLVMKSNEYGTARIAQGSSAGGYISGDATVERYIPQNSNKAWRMLATNTSGQTIKEAWQENQPALANGNPGYGMMITNRFATLADAQTAGFDTLSPSPSIYSFNTAIGNWSVLSSISSKLFASEEGYFVFIRGDRRSGQFVAGSAPVSATTLRSKGTIYQGDQPVKSVTAGKYSLLRNPYASALDMRNISIGGGTVDAFQVWDPKLTGTAGNGAYQTLTRVGPDYVVTPGGGSYPSSGSVFNTIESGAGLLVQATGSDGTVQILESSKASGSNLVFRPSSAQIDGKKIITNLYADDSAHTLVDGNMILFDNAHNNDVDKEDVRKLMNIGETFGILKSATELVVERRPVPASADTVQLSIRNLKRMNYTLEFMADNMDIPGMYGYIEDKYTGTGLLLNPSGSTSLNFSVNTDPSSVVADRFRLMFKPLSVLPVTFIDIKAIKENNGIAVQWKTANESNNAAYYVERSTDGINFKGIGRVNKSSQPFYNFIDVGAKTGIYYYRIRSAGNDSRVQYSKVVKVMVDELFSEIEISPNPVKDNLFNIHLAVQKAGKFEMLIYSTIGEEVYKKIITHTGGVFSQQVIVPAGLLPGVYQLQVILPDDAIKVQKLVVGQIK